MQLYQYHAFVCDQRKMEGAPCCHARGGAAVIDALRAEVARQGLGSSVQVTMCGSLGVCERGPNMVVYPEGTWYSGVQPGDVAEIVAQHFKQGRVVERLLNRDETALRAEIGLNRTRMLAALKRREEAGALPDPLQQTIRGFQESRAVLTGIELDVFTAVGAGASAADVARTIGADARATEMLVNALTAMGLLRKQGDTFTNTPESATYLAAGGAHDSRSALMHTAHLWTTWSRLTDSVRAGSAVGDSGAVTGRAQRARGGAERGAGAPASDRAGQPPPRLRRPAGASAKAGVSGGAPPEDDWTEAFIAAMHKNAAERAPVVVQAAASGSERRMLDVGGGSGAYSIAFAQAHPQLHVDLLDLPDVTAIASRHIAAASLGDRVHVRNGDLRTGALGRGEYDLVFLSAICHMLSPEENRDLLGRCQAAAAPGGRVVIQDFILDPSKTASKAGALFALNMLVGTRAGSSYSEVEYAEWLRAAGFTDVRHVSLHAPTSLMIAVRPA